MGRPRWTSLILPAGGVLFVVAFFLTAIDDRFVTQSPLVAVVSLIDLGNSRSSAGEWTYPVALACVVALPHLLGLHAALDGVPAVRRAERPGRRVLGGVLNLWLVATVFALCLSPDPDRDTAGVTYHSVILGMIVIGRSVLPRWWPPLSNAHALRRGYALGGTLSFFWFGFLLAMSEGPVLPMLALSLVGSLLVIVGSRYRFAGWFADGVAARSPTGRTPGP